jgi:predicted RNA-binding Zn ribbon-like protein
VFILLLCSGLTAPAAELRFGAATVDITPSEPVALDGQRGVRIAKKAETPISATALALETRDGTNVIDQAIMVSCDLVAIREGMLEKVRARVAPRLADFDARKLFLSATHTHTAPVTQDGRYPLPATGVMRPGDYLEWLTARLADAIVESWQKRAPGKVAWGQGQAVVAQNRRPLYDDGTAVMYGRTATEKFRGLEGYEDHNLEALFFWDRQDRLIATAINVACPAQEVEGLSVINADFWHPTREQLRARHGRGLHVLAWTGAGGDQSPHLTYGKAADERMRKLRGLSRLDEIARRVVGGWEEARGGAEQDKRSDVVLAHRVSDIALPLRKVTDAEVTTARREVEKFSKDPSQRWNQLWNQSVVTRYELQQGRAPGTQKMELHVLRLGDVAIASNEFELYTDFGVQMKARSPAVQTFVIQLAGSGGYLPTERAVAAGSYSAIIQSSRVGPDGGQALVDHTVAAMKELWPVQK